MNEGEAQDIVEKSLAFLWGRRGFDDWWHSIRSDDREDTQKEWALYLQKEVAPAPQTG
jgi:hypothetical protein